MDGGPGDEVVIYTEAVRGSVSGRAGCDLGPLGLSERRTLHVTASQLVTRVRMLSEVVLETESPLYLTDRSGFRPLGGLQGAAAGYEHGDLLVPGHGILGSSYLDSADDLAESPVPTPFAVRLSRAEGAADVGVCLRNVVAQDGSTAEPADAHLSLWTGEDGRAGILPYVRLDQDVLLEGSHRVGSSIDLVASDPSLAPQVVCDSAP